MSNQYRNALYYAAEQLKEDIEKYGIQVDSGERMIVWRGSAIPVVHGTTKQECLRMLRGMISAEKKLEAEKQLENQGVLL